LKEFSYVYYEEEPAALRVFIALEVVHYGEEKGRQKLGS
jgi:hypothetical protein